MRAAARWRQAAAPVRRPAGHGVPVHMNIILSRQMGILREAVEGAREKVKEAEERRERQKKLHRLRRRQEENVREAEAFAAGAEQRKEEREASREEMGEQKEGTEKEEKEKEDEEEEEMDHLQRRLLREQVERDQEELDRLEAEEEAYEEQKRAAAAERFHRRWLRSLGRWWAAESDRPELKESDRMKALRERVEAQVQKANDRLGDTKLQIAAEKEKLAEVDIPTEDLAEKVWKQLPLKEIGFLQKWVVQRWPRMATEAPAAEPSPAGTAEAPAPAPAEPAAARAAPAATTAAEPAADAGLGVPSTAVAVTEQAAQEQREGVVLRQESEFEKAWGKIRGQVTDTAAFRKILGFRDSLEDSDNPIVQQGLDNISTLRSRLGRLWEETDTAQVMKEIKNLQPSFDPVYFVDHYLKNELVPDLVQALCNDDISVLEEECSPVLAQALAAGFEHRRQIGQVNASELLDVRMVELQDALMFDDDNPTLIVHFAVHQTNCFKDAKTGEVVAGAEDAVNQVHYIMGMQMTEDRSGWKVRELSVIANLETF